MKLLLAPACLIACLFVFTSCESSIMDLSSAIRRGWDRLSNGKTSEPDALKIGEETGRPNGASEQEFVTYANEVSAIATKPTSDTQARGADLIHRVFQLNTEYPCYQPIPRDSMDAMMLASPPDHIGQYNRVNQAVFSQVNENTKPEELIPNLSFLPHKDYYINMVQYRNTVGKYLNVMVVDRGNLGGWSRAAHWYFLRQGKVGADEKDRYTFTGTTEKFGHTWVIWSSKKDGRKTYLSWWKDRWQINIDGAENLDAFEAINPQWLELVQ